MGRPPRRIFGATRNLTRSLRVGPTPPSVAAVLVLLAGTVAVVAVVAVIAGAPPATATATSNPIVIENQLPGTSSWRVLRSADDLNKQIKGYSSKAGVNVGESISFHVTVNRPQTFTIDVYRLGYYGGSGGRLMTTSGLLDGVPQAFPPLDPITGFVEYDWPAAFTLAVPTDWVSGVYVAKLTNADGYENLIPFAITNDQQPADFLFQRPVFTDQAYNSFPNVSPSTAGFDPSNPAHVGKSLYESNSGGDKTLVETTRAVKVSMNRPLNGNGAGGLFIWEFNLLQWLEKEGYNVTYSTNVETHENGNRLREVKGFISVAHDEYWTGEMFTAVEQARDNGTNLAFLGANAAYWQIRLEPSGAGDANRTIVAYKHGSYDPEPQPALKTRRFREVGRPEQTLIGVQYADYGDFFDPHDFVPINVDHWAYDASGITTDDTVANIVGYEIDQYDPAYPLPANTGYTLLAASPFTGSKGTSIQNSSIYQAPSGAWVFGAGTMSWSWALGRPGYEDTGLQQMTRNILDRFLAPGDGSDRDCSLTQEAENGQITGNRIQIGNDTNASGGRYIHLPDGTGNYWNGPDNNARIDYCFTVTQPGTYQINGGVHTLTNYSDSFYVTVNGAPTTGYTWDTKLNQTYQTDHVNNRNGADPVQVQLNAGTHTISIYGREDGTRLDTITLELAP